MSFKFSQQVATSNRLRTSGSTTQLYPSGTLPYPDHSQDDRTYALLESGVRRVDSCGSLDSHKQHLPVMMREVSHDHLSPQDLGYDQMRRTKSASSTSKPTRRHDFLKSRSPPARQPSPLVTDSQQQPVYHVLQQPGSPNPPESTPSPTTPTQLQQGAVYHVLQQPGSPHQLTTSPPPPQAPPVYQVLQQPTSPMETAPRQLPQQQPVYQELQQPDTAFQHEEFKQISVSPQHQPVYQVLQQPDDSFPNSAFQHEEFVESISVSSNGKGLTAGPVNGFSRRPISTTPHYKHQIDTTERKFHTTERKFRSKVKQQLCETASVVGEYLHDKESMV